MKICVTGKMKSGKTFFCEYLKQYGFHIFNTDNFINELYLFNNDGWKIIQQLFPNVDLYDQKQNVDKQKLLHFFIIKDPKINTLMNSLNKLIYEKINSLDNSLIWLIELGSYRNYWSFFKNLFNCIILIKTSKKNIYKRLINLNQKINKKHPGIKSSHFTKYDLYINNNKSLESFTNQINKIFYLDK